MINEVRLIGNVGKEPDIRSGGNWVKAKISLATTKKWRDKNGQWQEKTEWHTVVAWNTYAEYIEKYVTKGTVLYVAGSIEYGKYEKDGITRYFTEIVAGKIKALNKWKDRGDQGESYGGYGRNESFPEPPPIGDDVPF